MKRFWLWVCWTMVAATAAAQPLVAKRAFHLYLLVGQSNMAGRVAMETEDTAKSNRVCMLTKSGDWKPAKEPLHFDKPSVVGVGPGLAFGKALAAMDTTVVIGLIPCAVGGTSIDRWAAGAYDSSTKTHPYEDAIRRAKAAMQSGVLKGILWQQGESDSDSTRAAGYGEKLVTLVKRFRKDLDERKALFVAGTMAEFYTTGHLFAKRINEAIEALPRKTKNALAVSSSGLTHKGDKIHFDAASARELGRRYAEAVKKFYGMK